MNPNSFFVGDVVRLSGKTRHGKNRVRENGEFWEIITVDGGESSILSTKICVVPMVEERRENWRWLDVPEDEVVPNPIVGRKKGSVDFDDTLYRRRS